MAEDAITKLNGAKTSPANGEPLLPPKRGMIKAKIMEALLKSVATLAQGVDGKPKAGEGKDQSESGVFRCVRKAQRFGNSSVMDESTIVNSSGANTSPGNGGTLLPPKRGMIKAKIMEEFVKSITKLAPKARNVKPRPDDMKGPSFRNSLIAENPTLNPNGGNTSPRNGGTLNFLK